MKLEGSELWAWVTELPDGSRSIVGAGVPSLGTVPLVFASERVALKFEEIAKAHAKATRQPVALHRYGAYEELRRYD